MEIGKRTNDALYFHVSALREMPLATRDRTRLAERIAQVVGDKDYNVVKLTHTGPLVSLLAYSAFWEDPFPSLATAWTVNLSQKTGTVRRYAPDGNPPILHRKELLLAPEHPQRARFALLSEQLDAHGLSPRGSGLGFQRQWQAALKHASVHVQDHQLARGA